jgi:hypothetical protein
MGSDAPKIFLIIIATLYTVVTMAYTLEFVVTRSGWGLSKAIEYSLLWPTRIF